MRYRALIAAAALLFVIIVIAISGPPQRQITHAPETYQLRAVKNGFVDHRGQRVIAGEFETTGYFSEGLATVTQDGKYGFINLDGVWVIPSRFERASGFHEGLAAVTLDGKTGFVDRAGVFLEVPYQATQGFSEGLAAVRRDNKWGFVDRSGRLVIPATFANAMWFSEGMVAVQFAGATLGAGWGYVDHQGKTRIEPRFLTAGPFTAGVAPVTAGGGALPDRHSRQSPSASFRFRTMTHPPESESCNAGSSQPP